MSVYIYSHFGAALDRCRPEPDRLGWTEAAGPGSGGRSTHTSRVSLRVALQPALSSLPAPALMHSSSGVCAACAQCCR